MVQEGRHRSPFRHVLPGSLALALLSLATVAGNDTYAATDPTRPKDFSVAPDDSYRAPGISANTTPRLTSVLIAPNRRLAVIDGRLFAQGQQRSGIRVEKIFEDRVVVHIQGQEKTLLLNSRDMQKEIRE